MIRLKKRYHIIIVVLITLVFSLSSFCFFNRLFVYKHQNIIININYNNNPISKYHANEFNIKTSNYFEKNYARYIKYKNNHSNLTDDEIITQVNIGLDYSFYDNIRRTDLDDGLLILCNKYNTLSKDYVPELITMESKYSTGGKLHPVAYEAFKNLSDDARKLGYKIIVNSGYRSYDRQNTIYNNYVNRDGRRKADTYSARPGHSEHQTGLAIDVSNGDGYSKFGNTKEYLWMKENCYKYGYILRYTKENQWITGYMKEEWHYRYVGVEVATYIYENNITFEEYYANFIEKN